MEHTKGPWAICGNGTVLHPVTGRPLTTTVIEARDQGRIGEWLELSNESNTHLISASPDLLELCRSFVDCQDETAPTAFNMRFDTACAKARDIIAKAEGKA